MKKLLAGLATLIGVAACGEEAPYSHVVHYSSHDSVKTFFVSAASRGPLFVDIHGAYPGLDNAEEQITTGMVRGIQYRKYETTTRIEEAHSPSFRVIWVIAPPKSLNANSVCKGRIPASEVGDKPTFAAVFCTDDKVLRHMTGSIKPDVMQNSDTFQKFVGLMTRALFE